ncbi:MAG: rRNA pseudouridine synthase [Chloroflexota bacterium]|nr:rRNA pseudouridine synthase [Chloroflexota bacterium]
MLAARGVDSRRRSEDLIRAGRVSVNGRTVTEMGTKVDPRTAEIRVDGKLVRSQALQYVILNKPRGFITTMSDDRGRQTVMDLVTTKERVYPVGRLDRETEGLLLLTNDGEVANRVMHPRYGMTKEYHVLTFARPDPAVFRQIEQGVVIDGKKVVPDEFRILRESREGLILKIVVHEGINRIVRRLMEAVDIPVERLRRVRVGPLTLAGLPVGSWRELTEGERTTLVEALKLGQPSQSFTKPHKRDVKKSLKQPAATPRGSTSGRQ